MIKSILNYQKASEKLISSLKKNKKVLAAFVYGSIVNGDLWDESDIDIFVVYRDEFEEVRDIYSEVLDISVHMKILNKSEFINLYKTNGRRGMIRNLLISSKLVFSRDDEIENAYNNAKYSLDKYLEVRNLVYLGKLSKDIKVIKKYLCNDRLFTSYEVLIRALDSFSKLYLNLNGYTVSKDAVTMVMNLDNTFSDIVEDLFKREYSYDHIKDTLDYIEEFLNNNISNAAKFLLDYLYEKKEFLSSYDIKNDILFEEFDIKIEDILKELYKRNLVIKDSRKLNLPKGEKLVAENVYSCKVYNN